MNSKSSEKEQEIIKGIERMERNTRLIGSDFYDIKKKLMIMSLVVFLKK